MKYTKFATLSLLLFLWQQLAAQECLPLATPSPRHEIRAVWLTTLKGLDWPRTRATTEAEAERQKEDLVKTLDQLKTAGINTVLFQTRVRSTTAYPSEIEPWDGIFTGKPGQAPPYDPLRFALDECHKRNMELHAWVVAFPICQADVEKKLGKKSLPHKRPELCQKCGDQWMMDPGVPETADYLAELCAEIVKKYGVDGIHLDYIRYPEKIIPFDDKATYRKYGKGKSLAQWRKENVNRVVRKISTTIKELRPWIKFSCSPVGKYAALPRQGSYGWNARDAVHQDAQAWLKDGLMDCLFPMMYFDGKHFYPFAQDWEEQSAGRPVVPGLGIYFLHPSEGNWKLNRVTRQLNFIRQIGMRGVAHFRSKFLTDNTQGLYDYVAHTFDRRPALIPPMTWADSTLPAAPRVSAEITARNLDLKWAAVEDATPVKYNIYRLPTDTATLDDALLLKQGLTATQHTLKPTLPTELYAPYAVTALDAYGNESLIAKGRNVCRAGSAIPQPRVMLQLPEWVNDAKSLLVTDLTGRVVCKLALAQRIDVAALAPGFYELRGLNSKGNSFHIKNFRR